MEVGQTHKLLTKPRSGAHVLKSVSWGIPFPTEFPRLAIDTKGRAFGPAFRVDRESWEFPRTARKNGYGYFPAPDLNTVSHTMLPKPQAQRSDRKNKTWDPELRMETLDPDRNWIACFIHDTGFEAAQDRHNSPADPPHTKA